VGYLEPEFQALGIPFATRGAVTDDYLAAIRAIWTEPRPTHRGRFTAFASVQAHPQPTQKPLPPIVIGGHTDAAFRRAVEQGHGWYGFALDEDGARRCLDGLRAAAARFERPATLGPLEISVTPRPTRGGEAMDRASADRFAALGIHRLILIPPRSLDVTGLERFVEKTARELRGLLGPVAPTL
jgi:alkanesulfonate monooxygenase SsuD/methylene tetrahydromethanopterin reductase-like flavin-dependent oxidoreductase (luciferase family)